MAVKVRGRPEGVSTAMVRRRGERWKGEVAGEWACGRGVGWANAEAGEVRKPL